jgi:arylsulfatase A-like enzyme
VVEVDVNEFPNRLMGGHLSGRAVYDERYKYVVYDWGRYREQLFDLEADPGEMVNLATSSRFTPLLARMRASLREWCRKTDDAFLRRVPAGDGPAPY